MRRAMYLADVGDDCYHEDKTVARLEQVVAQLLGKEAGAFCASGTMSNLLAIAVHCKRGDEVRTTARTTEAPYHTTTPPPTTTTTATTIPPPLLLLLPLLQIILGETNHIYSYEGGGASSLLGVAFHPIPVLDNGTNKISDIVEG